jgi:hypothetical protein
LAQVAFDGHGSVWNEWFSRDDWTCLDSSGNASFPKRPSPVVWKERVDGVGNGSGRQYEIALGQCEFADIVCVSSTCAHALDNNQDCRPSKTWSVIASRVRDLEAPSETPGFTKLQLQPLSKTLVQVTGVHDADKCVLVVW